MTDRLNAIIVVLDRDIREDDAEPILEAIRQLRGVASVTGNVSDFNTHIAKEIAKNEIKTQIYSLLK